MISATERNGAKIGTADSVTLSPATMWSRSMVAEASAMVGKAASTSATASLRINARETIEPSAAPAIAANRRIFI